MKISGPKNNTVKVLLVEDDNDDYTLTRDFLSEADRSSFNLEWVPSYDAALKAIELNWYDVILLDYRLGEQTGLDFIREAIEKGYCAPIILLTGQGDYDVDVQAMKAGAVDYLAKDQVTAPLLERSIRYAVERKRAEMEQRQSEVQNLHDKRLQVVGSLAAGIAHEINTPIQFVGDNTQFLSDSFGSLLNLISRYNHLWQKMEAGSSISDLAVEKLRAEQDADIEYMAGEVPRAIEQTLDGVNRVASIVRAMKDFAHKDKNEKSMSDINGMLESTLTVARNELKYVAEVVTDFDLGLPQVECHRNDLNQVFLNLLVNAAHAIADVVGDGSSEKGTITVSTSGTDNEVIVKITDTGGGIPESIRDRIFDPFFTTKDVGKGTGQGLSIARSIIVEKHGGVLSFETEKGRGTTFVITLPMVSKSIEMGDKPACAPEPGKV